MLRRTVTTFRLCLVALAACTAIGCDKLTLKVVGNEIVMCPGEIISASQGKEQLVVTAIDSLNRTYQLNDLTVTVNLIPRRERWYGSLGLYRPYGKGDLHLVLDEGFQYFDSVEELRQWLSLRKDWFRYAYSSDGLTLGWAHQKNDGTAGPKEVLSVELWQVFVKGSKPNLSNIDNENSKITERGTLCLRKPGNYVASSPETINGRRYSGRALDFMKERKVSSEAVEKLIRDGKRSESDEQIDYHDQDHDSSGKGFSWVTLDRFGNVVSLG